ncbi:hypothetical protein [Amycolatopsis sp. NPDC006125]|uniref:hypothetical protein n=1 Tax=Amycolatopsis sp. NPDC006125 TaxID=3156730 RepID=UPI0033BEF842
MLPDTEVRWNHLTAADLRGLAARDAVPFDEITTSGVAGDARSASADKGTKLLDGCAQALADLLDEGLWKETHATR